LDGEIFNFDGFSHWLETMIFNINPQFLVKPPFKRFWLVVYTYPSEKYEFVSWDYYPQANIWKNKIHVPNHQPG